MQHLSNAMVLAGAWEALVMSEEQMRWACGVAPLAGYALAAHALILFSSCLQYSTLHTPRFWQVHERPR